MILGVLKWNLHKEKVIPTQLPESLFLPYCLLLLCHKMVVQRYSRCIKDMKNAFFETPHNEIKYLLFLTPRLG